MTRGTRRSTAGHDRRRQKEATAEEVETLVPRDRHDSLESPRLAGARRAIAALLSGETWREDPTQVDGSETTSVVPWSLQAHSLLDIGAHEELVVNTTQVRRRG